MTPQDYQDPHQLADAAVVVGVDGSPGSELALRWAADFAAQRGRALEILHGLDLVGASRVVGAYEVIVPPLVDSVRARGTALIAHADLTARTADPGLRVSSVLSSDTGQELLLTHSAKAYAVVLGATGNTGTLGHLGSTLLAVTAHAQGAVIVVRPDPKADNTVRTSGPVVVGVDGSPVSEAAVAAAFFEASDRGTDLVAVHVWSDWDAGKFAGKDASALLDNFEEVEEAILAERLAGWQEKYPDVEVIRRVYFAGPAAQLREWSEHAQLVVVGNRGRGGFLGLLLGSTAHALVQHAHCPVMVVHGAP
ncbi:universal stress protein [Nocardia sp. SYP-A9097]|uniref:universal stress protein n=1 Tax=Nocardia sp. SYP-A9097 TaxID=2663237 RepID=UPI00129B503B|nr:universal stress protein [Nocardia sp. SYP-A9097]MRH87627.1 universal stress protein [Nocardia sp. SYP-A9097]